MSYNMNMDNAQGQGFNYGYSSSYSTPPHGAYPAPPNPNPNPTPNPLFPADMLTGFGGAGLVGNAALQLGNERLSNMRSQVEGLVNVGQIKYYFKVDTQYVKKKLARIFCPFMTKDWERDGRDGKALPPKDDLNTPDMYIPVMSFITYILTVGLILGVADKFSPEQLGSSLSSGVGWLVAELAVYRTSLYLLSIPFPSFYELTCIVGYKYPSMVCVCVLYVMMQSMVLYHVAVVYLGAALFYFTYRTATATSGSTDGVAHKRRQLFFFVMSGLQVAFLYFLTLALVMLIPA